LQHLTLNASQLQLKPSDLDTLRRLCRGVLKACSTLSLDVRAWSKEDTVALMAVLSQDWQPSAEALQPIRSNSSSLETSSSSDATLRWSLELYQTHCSRQCLELLPKGLSALDLRWGFWLHTVHFCHPHALVCLYYFLCLL
jgi:hypothetical protein